MRRSCGVFLIDALCAGVVLTILVTVAYAGFHARRAGAREELEATRARYLAFSLLEQVRADARMGLVAEGEHEVDAAAWHLPEGTEARWTVRPAVDGPEGLWEVSARVRWPAARSTHGTVARWREAVDHTWIATNLTRSGGSR